MGALPGGIYTKGIRYIGGTTNANLTLAPFHIWDTDDSVVTAICDQQVIAVVIPSEELLDKFLLEINQVALKPELYRASIGF
jgi:hypothetical protein